MTKTIKSSLTIINSLGVALVCACVIVFTLTMHERLYIASATNDLDALSQNMASDLVPYMAPSENDIFGITTTFLGLDPYTNVKYAVAFDTNGKIVQQYTGTYVGQEIEQRVFDEEAYHALSHGIAKLDGELISFKRIGDKGYTMGDLLIVNDLYGPLSKSKRSLLAIVIPLCGVILVFGSLLSFWLNHIMLLPFRKLASVAQQIKHTNDYSIEVDVYGKKEVQDLSREFSSMMKTIYAEELKIKEYTKQLTLQRKDMEQLANFDNLTGLPNRHYFMVILEEALFQAQERKGNCSLMYIDLDAFKTVNDTHGHELGDMLLQEVSNRIKRQIDPDDQLARLGGDEFLLLIEGEKTPTYLKVLADSLIEALSDPFIIVDWELNISASIGIAQATSANYNISDFISNADVAMYESKAIGKNCYTFFNDNMQQQKKRQILIVNSIQRAVANDEFELHYQAKVNGKKEVVGFEALIRWIHPKIGFVPPDEFIGLAEQSGKVHQITNWVIEQSCKDLAKLKLRFGGHIKLSLNLSSLDLKQTSLAGYVRKLFRKYSVEPSCIEFEVTESAYLENFEDANRFFDEMNTLGCSIALDDFGTGYSSLSYLTQIDINTLKIDKQFIDHIGTSSRQNLVTKTIINMAIQLNLRTCAEGVETQAQAEFLLNEGCDELQGYLYCKPQPLANLVELAHEPSGQNFILKKNVVLLAK